MTLIAQVAQTAKVSRMMNNKQYQVIVIDPPWPSSGYPSGGSTSRRRVEWSAKGCCKRTRDVNGGHLCSRAPTNIQFDYDTMSIAELANLELPLADDGFVFLWTINSFIRDAYDLLDAWRLRFRFMGTWVKPNGPKPVGYPTYNSEWYLCASQGKPIFTDTKQFRAANLWDSPRNPNAASTGWGRQIRNCTKPEDFYKLLLRVTDGPRLDMFNRRPIAGFDTWGNEAETQPAVI